MISEVYSNNTPLTTSWDPGANLLLVSNDAVAGSGLNPSKTGVEPTRF